MPALRALVRRHVLVCVVGSSLLAVPGNSLRAQVPVAPPGVAAPLSAASAVLIVEPRGRADGGAAESDAQLQRRIQTHVATIASEHHLRRVVSDSAGDVRRTQWFRASGDVDERAAWLRDHVRVTAVPGTSLIEIALPDLKDASERKAILFAVAGVYLDANGGPNPGDRREVLQRLQTKARDRLTTLVQERGQAQARLNAGGGDRIATKEIELSRLIAEQIDAALRAQKAAAKQEAVTAAVQQDQPVPGEDQAVRKQAPFLANEEQAIHQMDVEVSVSRDQLGPNNPKVLALEKRLELTRARFVKKQAAVREGARAAIVEETRVEAATAKATADGMAGRVEALKKEVGEQSSAMLTVQSLQEEERGLREQVRLVTQQIDNLAATHAVRPGGADICWHLMPEAAQPR